eukprot:4179545-Prymnesium_polylepis.1
MAMWMWGGEGMRGLGVALTLWRPSPAAHRRTRGRGRSAMWRCVELGAGACLRVRVCVGLCMSRYGAAHSVETFSRCASSYERERAWSCSSFARF